MKDKLAIHQWIVRHLEEPFYQAEIYKTELDEDAEEENESKHVLGVCVVLSTPIILVLAGILNI